MKTQDGKKDTQRTGAKVQSSVPRREFLAKATGVASVMLLAGNKAEYSAGMVKPGIDPGGPGQASRLALRGGSPVRGTKLAANFPGPLYYDEDEQRELLDVLKRRAPFRWYGVGPKGGKPHQCDDFEREFAARQNTRFCVAVTSGTMALCTALAALGVGPGDEVILPTWTWYSCYNAIVAAGATPVFAEIDDSMDINPNDIESHVTPHTKVIMVVHILGEPANMDPILEIARRHKLKVLEDCAQSVGATYRGAPVGSMGNCGIYSFQECKTITAGEGGSVVTKDPVIFERASRFHDLGVLRDSHAQRLGQPPHFPQFLGGQFRMSEFTGAVLRAQLRKLDRIVADFQSRATRVMEGIQDLPGIRFRRSNDPQGAIRNSIYFQTPDKARRDLMIAALEAENVPAARMEGSVILPIAPYIEQKRNPNMVADWPSFSTPESKALRYGAACCPRTLELYDRFVGIPMDPQYSDQDVADIIAAVRKVYPAILQA